MPDDPKLPDSRLLADLFDDRATPIWSDDDLAAVFRHQMSIAITVGLNESRLGGAAKFATICAARGLLLKSFGDLLAHPNPPVELLQMMKRFAKAMRNHPDAPLPAAVATLFYYAAIASAMARASQRITELDDVSLRKGLEWSVAQPWIDESTRSLLRSALAAISKTSAEVHS